MNGTHDESRERVAHAVLTSSFTFTLNEGTETSKVITVRKLSWQTFLILKDILKDIVEKSAVQASPDGESMMVDFSKLIAEAPFLVIDTLLKGCVDFPGEELPPVEEWAFDDVLGLTAAVIDTHFVDNKKVQDFFATVTNLLQGSPQGIKATVQPDPDEEPNPST